MSSPSSGGTTTTKTELPDWAQPYAKQLLERGAALSNQEVPQYNGQLVAGMNGTQTGAISGLTGAAANQAGTATAASNIAQQLAGGSAYQTSNPFTGNVTASTAANSYADPANNPYLASTVAASNKQITDAYQNTTAPTALAQFRNAGAFGGSAQAQVTGQNEQNLATALSNNTAGMYNSAYNTAANVASQNAAQQNQVNLANQSVGTAANQASNAQNSSNYYNWLNAQQAALTGASNANNASSNLYGNQYAGGAAQQANSQSQLDAAYQQWWNKVNAPYAQLSTLSSALSGALGNGTGTSVTSQSGCSGGLLASLLGAGTAGLGAYSLLK